MYVWAYTAIVIAYLNHENAASEVASRQMMDFIVEEFGKINGHNPVYVTICTETKDKYNSLSKLFQNVIDTDLK
jgi:hypothetical protein